MCLLYFICGSNSTYSLQERWGYICPDVAKEFAKYDSDPDKWMKKYDGMNSVTKQVCVLP